MTDEELTALEQIAEEAAIDLDGRHPLQYGFERLPDGRQVATFNVTPRPELVPGEIYNRCPNCEEWSPCSLRKAVEALAALRLKVSR